MRRALRIAARADAAVLADYATPLGLPALRQLLTRRLAASDIDATPERILLTESGTQAVDLICRFFLEPGDTVLVDDPCYFNFHALLRAHRAKAVGVPFTPNGPDPAAFEAALREHSPRLYLTNSGIHNPTGAALSPVVAHRLLKLAEDSNLIIVEDDIFADFETDPAPRLAAFDGLARVIHIGSFSKTISASLRCGFIAARADWIDSLTDLKIATSFGGGQLAFAVLLTALTDSGYRKHMEAVRVRLAAAMEKTIARLEAMSISPWIVPRAGMFVWARLPKGIDAANIARSCLQDGIVLAPGNAFSQSLNASGFLRFNVAQSSNPRIFDVLARPRRFFVGQQDIGKSAAAVRVSRRAIQGHEERLDLHRLCRPYKRCRQWLTQTMKSPDLAQSDMKMLAVEYSTGHPMNLRQLGGGGLDRMLHFDRDVNTKENAFAVWKRVRDGHVASRYRFAKPYFVPADDASSLARSSLRIDITARIKRSIRCGSPEAMTSSTSIGETCQDKPKRSLHQPQISASATLESCPQ